MKIKSRIVGLLLGVCCFGSLPLPGEAAEVVAEVERISYEVSEENPGEVRVVIQGNKLQEMAAGIWQTVKIEEMPEAAKDSEPKAELSFIERILLAEEEKGDEKPKKPKVLMKREMTLQNVGLSKNFQADLPAEAMIQGEGSIVLRVPYRPSGRWGESEAKEFIPGDSEKEQKAKRKKKQTPKKDKLIYTFTWDERPEFRPNYAEALKGKIIVLDPGHGGKDPGAVGLAGTLEKEVNLMVSLQMRDELQKWGARPVMTRSVDTSEMDKLQTRVDYGTFNGGNIFVSIHSDAALNRRAKGFTVYYHNQKGELDLALAKSVQLGLKGTMQTNDRGVRSAHFYVVKRNPLPAILIEMGFISNAEEEINLMEVDYQRDVVEGAVQGLANYFKEEPTLLKAIEEKKAAEEAKKKPEKSVDEELKFAEPTESEPKIEKNIEKAEEEASI